MLQGVLKRIFYKFKIYACTYKLMNQSDPAEPKEANLFLNWESNCAVFASYIIKIIPEHCTTIIFLFLV